MALGTTEDAPAAQAGLPAHRLLRRWDRECGPLAGRAPAARFVAGAGSAVHPRETRDARLALEIRLASERRAHALAARLRRDASSPGACCAP